MGFMTFMVRALSPHWLSFVIFVCVVVKGSRPGDAQRDQSRVSKNSTGPVRDTSPSASASR